MGAVAEVFGAAFADDEGSEVDVQDYGAGFLTLFFRGGGVVDGGVPCPADAGGLDVRVVELAAVDGFVAGGDGGEALAFGPRSKGPGWVAADPAYVVDVYFEEADHEGLAVGVGRVLPEGGREVKEQA